jgi:t-SNARE complex subunit (syntaxin)
VADFGIEALDLEGVTPTKGKRRNSLKNVSRLQFKQKVKWRQAPKATTSNLSVALGAKKGQRIFPSRALESHRVSNGNVL